MQKPFEIPYYAVIFTSTLTDKVDGYGEAAARMEELAAQQPGYLGLDSARDAGLGITVSYWKDEASIANWKRNLEHLAVQGKGRRQWYASYTLHVAKVERRDAFGA